MEVILFRSRKKKPDCYPRLKLNGKYLSFSDSVKYLGITLEPFLNWERHIHNVCLKLKSATGIISKLRYYLPQQILKSVYHALFNSHLNYSCQVWGQGSNRLDRIIILQKRCIRLITFSEFRAHSSPLFHQLSLLKFPDLVKLHNLISIHNICNKSAPSRIVNTYSLRYYPEAHVTRGKRVGLFVTPMCQTSTYGIRSVLYQSIDHWNSLQKHFPDTRLATFSIAKFKTIVFCHLLAQY